jgi:hypothetical protein
VSFLATSTPRHRQALGHQQAARGPGRRVAEVALANPNICEIYYYYYKRNEGDYEISVLCGIDLRVEAENKWFVPLGLYPRPSQLFINGINE